MGIGVNRNMVPFDATMDKSIHRQSIGFEFRLRRGCFVVVFMLLSFLVAYHFHDCRHEHNNTDMWVSYASQKMRRDGDSDSYEWGSLIHNTVRSKKESSFN